MTVMLQGMSLSLSFCLFSVLLCKSINQDSLRSLRFSVENAYIDEKEDACDALGEIAFNTG